MKMCHALASQGYHVRLFIPSYPKSEYEPVDGTVFQYYGTPENFKILRSPWLPVRGRSTMYSLMTAVRAVLGGADLAYGRDLKTCFVGAVLGMPTVWEAHAPRRPNDRIFKRLVASKNFKGLVVISEALRKIYEKDHPQIRGKLVVAHDGADPPSAEGINMARTGNALRVGYVGHLYKGRGIELIIEIAKRCPWADFEIVGGVDELVSYWSSKAQDLNNIHFHGHLPYDSAGRIRQACDVLLAPFERSLEVFGGGGDTSEWMSPLKIFEYMSVGKPIISTDLPVLREVLEDERTALFCAAGDVDAWQQALERLRDDPDLCTRLAKQAQALLEKKYTWSRRARKVIDGVL